ncbi:MAG: hypothetical protein WCI05_14625 [Myxococcales bacterium]
MPSKMAPNEDLVTKLVKTIQTCTEPPTLRQLFDLAGVSHDAASFKAVNSAAFKRVAFLTTSESATSAEKCDAYVLRPHDLPDFLGSDTFLEHHLRRARKGKTHGFTEADLAKLLPGKLKVAFREALDLRMTACSLPSTVGVIAVKKASYLFLVAEARAFSQPVQAEPPKAEPLATTTEQLTEEDFATAFDLAFTRLDRETGELNFVPLLPLRNALAWCSRERFDIGLRELRIHNKFGLDSPDGRHVQLSDDERDAGITEAGRLLVYVVRK